MSVFTDLFGGVKPVIGMIHLRPLPGSPRGGDLQDVLAAAQADAEVLTGAGVDGMIVENFGDAPFAKGRVPAVTIAAMTVVARELRRDHNVPLGVNVLRNDAEAALAIASVTQADFIRVNVHVGAVVADQGIIEGRARKTLLLRRSLGSPVLLFADVRVKHARPLGATESTAGVSDLATEACDVFRRGLADALILSGVATGVAADPEDFRRVRKVLPEAPLLVGSGADPGNLETFWPAVDGIIVGSALKNSADPTQPVDPVRAREMLAAASRLKRAPEGSATRGT